MESRLTCPRGLLLGSFQAALSAADPLAIVPKHLPAPPRGKTVVVGAGKAAASMALAVETHWPKDAPLEGVVITRYGHGLPLQRIRVVEAGHPVPDTQGEAAAREILALARQIAFRRRPAPRAGVGRRVLAPRASRRGGAHGRAEGRHARVARERRADPGHEHGEEAPLGDPGRQARTRHARVLALVISDVTGDDPTHIASGPCTADPSTYGDAIDILARHGVTAPPAVASHLARGAKGEIAETPKPGDAALAHADNRVIATAHAALACAAAFIQHRGVTPMVLGDSVTGESSEVAKVYAALARQVREHSHPLRPPVALISGGETTVTIRGQGRGGRCTEFLLSLAISLEALPDTWALACDTDGIDGSEDNAGAILTPDALARAAAAGLAPKRMLAGNDGYGFFHALGDLVVTGPTRTNVNDYRIILVR